MQSQIFGWSNLKTFWVISAAFCAHLFLTFLLSIKYCHFDGAKPYNCVSLFQQKFLLLLAYESIQTTKSNLKENTLELPLQYAVMCLRCVHEQRRGGGIHFIVKRAIWVRFSINITNSRSGSIFWSNRSIFPFFNFAINQINKRELRN